MSVYNDNQSTFLSCLNSVQVALRRVQRSLQPPPRRNALSHCIVSKLKVYATITCSGERGEGRPGPSRAAGCRRTEFSMGQTFSVGIEQQTCKCKFEFDIR
jgi:hypothetical protein